MSSNPTSSEEGGAGRKAGSSPFGYRNRVKRLYRSRRERLLVVPHAALVKRFGSQAVELDTVEARSTRTELSSGVVIEAGFKGNFRMFGALIDTQWVGRIGEPPGDTADLLEYRFDKEAFRVRQGDETTKRLAERLCTARMQQLAKDGVLKSIRVLDAPGGRQVEIIPLAGTITAMYFPPLPPYTVPIKPEEATVQLELTLLLLEA
jgi:hypothetical protein